ncbi:UNVERIFIED_CONTAM: hypothetical protein Cloal_4077 [Acetivibrio alkalicellulosi]
MEKTRVSPPWYTFANQINYTYGRSPYVKVRELKELKNGNYVLNIYVKNKVIAYAVRQVLPLKEAYGNIEVYIKVYDPSRKEVKIAKQVVYTDKKLAKLFCVALYKNPLFVGAVLTGGKVPQFIDFPQVAIVIKKAVVQFFNDDISDLCSNYNEVAAKVFEEVTTLRYPVRKEVTFTTQDKKCGLQKNL